MNDTKITYNDLRSNDLWCIGYLILILLDSEFANCYSFNPNNVTKIIHFDPEKFLVLYKNLCGQNRIDENLIYVLNKVIGIERFFSGNHLIIFR